MFADPTAVLSIVPGSEAMDAALFSHYSSSVQVSSAPIRCPKSKACPLRVWYFRTVLFLEMFLLDHFFGASKRLNDYRTCNYLNVNI